MKLHGLAPILWTHITMEKVDELWEEYREKVTVEHALENQDYLMRDFSILDNNGYVLVFGEVIGEHEVCE